MGMGIRIGLVALALAALAGCDSSTEPESPKLKTGATADLAIDLPLIWPPPPRDASIATPWSVILAGRLWFRNTEAAGIELKMWVTDKRTGSTAQAGTLHLDGFSTKPMILSANYTTNIYRDHSWSLQCQAGDVIRTINVGIYD